MSSKAEAISRTARPQTSTKQKTNQFQWKNASLGLVIPAILLIIWESASRLGWIESYLLPAPSIVAAKVLEMAQDGSLWGHVSITLYRVFIGFFLGTAVAIVLGAFVGYFKRIEQLFDPILQAVRSIPSLAWVPLFLLWMGIGEPSKITLIAVGVFFPVYLNIVSGIQGVDRKLIEVGRVYHFSSYQIVRRIILPASLPSFLVGMRSGLGLGWMFVVAAELLGASKGLGYLLVLGQNTSSPELIIASIFLFALLGKGSDAVLKKFEQYSLKWQDNLQNVK